VKIYTSDYLYYGKNRLDITVKGQDILGQYFAPSWRMVKDFKSGKITEDEYIKKYDKILNSITKPVWRKLYDLDDVVLVCFCKKGNFCHRILLAKRIVQDKMGEYLGEI